MSMFSADGVIRSIIGALGITPEQVAQVYNQLSGFVNRADNEVAAFKAASVQVVREFNGQLVAIREEQAAINAKLDLLLQTAPVQQPLLEMAREPAKLNGADAHE